MGMWCCQAKGGGKRLYRAWAQLPLASPSPAGAATAAWSQRVAPVLDGTVPGHLHPLLLLLPKTAWRTGTAPSSRGCSHPAWYGARGFGGVLWLDGLSLQFDKWPLCWSNCLLVPNPWFVGAQINSNNLK